MCLQIKWTSNGANTYHDDDENEDDSVDPDDDVDGDDDGEQGGGAPVTPDRGGRSRLDPCRGNWAPPLAIFSLSYFLFQLQRHNT